MISLLRAFDILSVFFFLLLITFCFLSLVKRCKQTSQEVGDSTEVICTHLRSKRTSTRPIIPDYNSPIFNTTTSTSPSIMFCSIHLYNSATSTIPYPISPIHFCLFQYLYQLHSPHFTYVYFSCSTPITSILPIPPCFNNSDHYMVSKLY